MVIDIRFAFDRLVRDTRQVQHNRAARVGEAGCDHIDEADGLFALVRSHTAHFATVLKLRPSERSAPDEDGRRVVV